MPDQSPNSNIVCLDAHRDGWQPKPLSPWLERALKEIGEESGKVINMPCPDVSTYTELPPAFRKIVDYAICQRITQRSLAGGFGMNPTEYENARNALSLNDSLTILCYGSDSAIIELLCSGLERKSSLQTHIKDKANSGPSR